MNNHYAFFPIRMFSDEMFLQYHRCYCECNVKFFFKTLSEDEYGSCSGHQWLESCQKRACVYNDESILVSDCLIKCTPIACCSVIAMPSGKLEIERKGNALVNSGPSPNSDGRVNNLMEEADEPARGSGPLQDVAICR
ncbi:hypothetical protein T4C_1838 [Trichinella pseudospiralis]|uniref:Uncharacterized protein n=1 Tax=Trichinella pseudospiralis TaxID=6337 RepID=A0A0V1JLM0_TRIPS|nr:hypothetical protein T4C_1838 [Trichinella pseudospiralis]